MITPIGLEILRGAGTAEHLDVCLWRPMQEGLKSACKAGRQPPARPLTHTNTPPPLLLMLLPAISVFIIIFHASSCSDEQQGVIYTALNLCYFYSIRVSKNKQTRKQKSWALMSEVNFPSEVKGFWLCDFLRLSCMNFKGLTTDFQ